MFMSKAGHAVIRFMVVIGTVALLVIGFTGTTPSAYAGGPAALENDLPIPEDDAKAVEGGKSKFGERCGLCHGGGGRGGKGPCLTCGHFKRGGKSSNLYANIAAGVPGTPMGAFGTTVTQEEIFGIIAYLRTETKRRAREGEITDPYAAEEEMPVFPGEKK